MSQVRCPNCFTRFRPTRARTAARQLEDHLNPGPFEPMRCIELRRQAGKVIRDAALQDPFFRKLVDDAPIDVSKLSNEERMKLAIQIAKEAKR